MNYEVRFAVAMVAAALVGFVVSSTIIHHLEVRHAEQQQNEETSQRTSQRKGRNE